MTKVFISYHHANDQEYKNTLADIGRDYGLFENCSVNPGEIPDEANVSSETIRTKIRDEYLRESQVTILLCGKETQFRKHIDWELKSSMIDGAVNKKSGILVINLPTVVNSDFCSTSFPDEEEIIYPEVLSWTEFKTESQWKERFPDMPQRIIDNLLKEGVKIPVMPWKKAMDNFTNLTWLINSVARNAHRNDYDLSLPMKRKNYNP